MHQVYTHLLYRDKETSNIRQAYTSWFCDIFPEQEFRGIERVFREFMGFTAKLEVPIK